MGSISIRVTYVQYRKAYIIPVVSSLFGKVPHCDCGEQGSIPGDTQKCEWSMVNFKIDKQNGLTIHHSHFQGSVAQLDRAWVF